VAFNGARLRLGRLFRNLTQSELAREVAASPALLCQIETGTRGPSSELVDALAHVLGFEPVFFHESGEDEFRQDECNFRKRRSTPERLLKRLAAQVTLFGMVVRHLRDALDPPQFAVPKIVGRTGEEIEQAAEACREGWDLQADAPIENVSRVLERAGVVLTGLDEGFAHVGSFSRFGSVSLVIVDTSQQSPTRIVFDMAHELGHGVLHRGVRTGTPDTERDADRFAAAFLLPRAGFRREFLPARGLDWGHLFELKGRWRTAVSVMVRRGYDLGLLDPATYRRAYKHLYAQGWARGEPSEPELENLGLFRLTLEALEKNGARSVNQIATQLQWKPETLEEVTGLRPLAPAAAPRVLSLDEFREKRSAVGLSGA